MAAFGTIVTDPMVVCTWTANDGWSSVQLRSSGLFELEPGSAVLHHGQEIFEGLKACWHPDGDGGEVIRGAGTVTARLTDAWSDIQDGRASDPHGWMRVVPRQRLTTSRPGDPGAPPDGGSVASGTTEIGSVQL